MLIILYITSVLASFLTPIHDCRGEYKKYLSSLATAIISGLLYTILAVIEIYQNINDLYFGTIFGLLSLVFLDFAFLSENSVHWLEFLTAAFLGSIVLYILNSGIYFSDYLISCNETHIVTETVPIVTTVDGTEFGESIYGEGFVIGQIDGSSPSKNIYVYNYMGKYGTVASKKTHASRTIINHIDADELPYVKITHFYDCLGYSMESQNHVYCGCLNTYVLYIPENSIINITPAS